MRSAYNRTGLAVLALYGAMGVVQSLTAVLSAVVCILRYYIVYPIEFMNAAADLKDAMNSVYFDYRSILTSPLVQDTDLVIWVFSGMMLGSLLGMLTGILFMRKITGRTRITPVERIKLTFGQFLAAAVMAYGLWGVGAAIGNITVFFGVSADNSSILDYVGKGIYAYYAYAVLGAPIVEELAFRKTLIDANGHFGSVVSAFVTALLFGLIHGNSNQFLLAFNIGLLFACIYRYTGKIIYTILLHGMINLTATIPDLFAIFGIDVWYYWNFAVLALVGIGLIVVFAMKNSPMLRLERPEIPNANRAAFLNPGMLIVCIAGLLQMLGTDLMNLYSNWGAAKDLRVLISLIPVVISLATVITVMCTVGRHQKYTDHEETEILQVLV